MEHDFPVQVEFSPSLLFPHDVYFLVQVEASPSNPVQLFHNGISLFSAGGGQSK